jgi:hypothetical protein
MVTLKHENHWLSSSETRWYPKLGIGQEAQRCPT